MMKAFVFLFLTASISNSFSAEVDEKRAWFGVFSRKENKENSLISHQELQLRYNLETGSNQQLLIRFGILKPITKFHELGFLFGFIEGGEIKEYRPTLQHVYSHQDDEYRFLLRSRMEWRDWEDERSNSIRYRLQIQLNYTLTNKNTIVVWDEPFLNISTNKLSGNQLLERNRAFIGIRFPISGHNLEAGYLNQFIPRQSDLTEHIAVIYLYF
ncbi:MAG: DUF2490 domain-containing protein [Bacteriovoracaceae bacterium]|jgi:hypothetical protein